MKKHEQIEVWPIWDIIYDQTVSQFADKYIFFDLLDELRREEYLCLSDATKKELKYYYEIT